MWTQKVPGGGVLALAYSPDGRTLYTADAGYNVSAWDLTPRTGGRIFEPPKQGISFPSPLVVAGEGRFLAASDGNFWLIWDVTAGGSHSLTHQLRTELEWVFDPHGTTVWRVSGTAVRRWDFVKQEFDGELGHWKIPGNVRYARVSPDGRRVAVVASRGDVYLVELPTGRPEQLDLSDLIFHAPAVVFSPDGDTLAILYHRLLYLWDVPNRRVRGKAVWADPNEHWKLSFHPTARVFAALNKDKVLTLFSLDTGDPIRSLDFALGRSVRCAAFAPDGLTCAVGGSNKQFAVFDVDL